MGGQVMGGIPNTAGAPGEFGDNQQQMTMMTDEQALPPGEAGYNKIFGQDEKAQMQMEQSISEEQQDQLGTIPGKDGRVKRNNNDGDDDDSATVRTASDDIDSYYQRSPSTIDSHRRHRRHRHDNNQSRSQLHLPVFPPLALRPRQGKNHRHIVDIRKNIPASPISLYNPRQQEVVRQRRLRQVSAAAVAGASAAGRGRLITSSGSHDGDGTRFEENAEEYARNEWAVREEMEELEEVEEDDEEEGGQGNDSSGHARARQGTGGGGSDGFAVRAKQFKNLQQQGL